MLENLELNLTGRVMLVSCKYGVHEATRVAIFVRAIIDVLRHDFPDKECTWRVVEPLIVEQLALLETSMKTAQRRRIAELESDKTLVFEPVVEKVEEALVEEIVEESVAEVEEKPARRRRKPLQSKGGPINARSMEEKLQDEREPIQKLLMEDCVAYGLVNKKEAKHMVRSMLGKTSQDAEIQIVETLRQTLHDQVKNYIRKNKGGPWANPQQQEDMRQDIHHAKTVKSILMLSRQISKERRVWEKKTGKGGGVLSLFSGRKKGFA